MQITVHTFPLPYHNNAFRAAQAGHFARHVDFHGSGFFFEWMSTIFRAQETFGNSAIANMTEPEVIRAMAKIAAAPGPGGAGPWTTVEEFTAGMSDSALNGATRASWKYGCSRGVSGTPTFMINGVLVTQAQADWTVADWRNVIDPLLEL
jgi:hypothetical protein